MRRRKPEQGLRGAQRHEHRAAIEVAHAQVDDAGDRERVGHRRVGFRGDEPEPVAQREAQVLCEVLADDRLAGLHAVLAGDELLVDGHDPVVTLGLDAEQGDRFGCIAADREAGPRRHRRHRGDLGFACSARSSACHWSIERSRCARFDARQHRLARGRARWGRATSSVGRMTICACAEHAPDRVRLQPVDERGDKDHHRHAGGRATDDERGLKRPSRRKRSARTHQAYW
jgi:hypothetical protein